MEILKGRYKFPTTVVGDIQRLNCKYGPIRQMVSSKCEFDALEGPKWTRVDSSKCNIPNKLSKKLEDITQVLHTMLFQQTCTVSIGVF